MPKLTMLIQHNLPKEEAMRRIQTLFKEIKQKYAAQISNVQEEWNDNSGQFQFSVMSFPFSGTITVEATQVKLEGVLPLVASAFKSEIEKTIRQQANEILNSES